MASSKKTGSRAGERGKLRIGDDWNAITIIALSQSNPVKAVAELVPRNCHFIHLIMAQIPRPAGGAHAHGAYGPDPS